ncbi:MAG: flagellar export chaperone FliS [Azospirillum brasilense]|nr:MAG: flagellar export chaperone FliS [Azospirillum brasilense]
MPEKTNHYKAYSRASHTVAKTRQVVMLYDGAIRFLSQAKEAMEKNEIERRYTTLLRATDIIVGLQACLDFDAGGNAANVLFEFYNSMEMRIMQLHRTNDVAACATIIAELKEMREVWNGIDQQAQPAAVAGGQAAPAPAANPTDPLSSVIVSA